MFLQDQSWSKQHPLAASLIEHKQTKIELLPNFIEIPRDETDVWEIDTRLLKVENKVGSGSYGDL